MRIIADTHTHTLMSGHAHSTLIENIAEAKRKGLAFLAVTDHTGIMPGAPDDTYFTCMRGALPDRHDGVYLLRGCEANILDENGMMDISDAVLSRLEWVIASIHSLLTAQMDAERHTRLWLNISKNPHVDVIGHCGEERFRFDYEAGVRAFAERGKIVEINASSFRSRPDSIPNCLTIAKLCAKHGVSMVVSSDAHFAASVGEFSHAVQLLEAAGVPEALVLNADYDRFAGRLHSMTGRTFDGSACPV